MTVPPYLRKSGREGRGMGLIYIPLKRYSAFLRTNWFEGPLGLALAVLPESPLWFDRYVSDILF